MTEIKGKTAAIVTNSLGDLPFCVCCTVIENTLKLIELLDQLYATMRSASRISTLNSVYSKNYQNIKNIGAYIDEFESLFAQLEIMGNDTDVPESHKLALLLASMGTTSILESSVAVLRVMDTVDLTWQLVTAGLILEYRQTKGRLENKSLKKTAGGYKPRKTTMSNI